jgi:benzoyl-CoA reductase subunit C
MFVTHPICDAARNLAAVWGRNFDYPLPDPVPAAERELRVHAPEYLRGEYERLLREVEEVAGRTVTDDDLRRSIVFNRTARCCGELYAL